MEDPGGVRPGGRNPQASHPECVRGHPGGRGGAARVFPTRARALFASGRRARHTNAARGRAQGGSQRPLPVRLGQEVQKMLRCPGHHLVDAVPRSEEAGREPAGRPILLCNGRAIRNEAVVVEHSHVGAPSSGDSSRKNISSLTRALKDSRNVCAVSVELRGILGSTANPVGLVA